MDTDVRPRDQSVTAAADVLHDAAAKANGLGQAQDSIQLTPSTGLGKAQDSIQLTKSRLTSAASKTSDVHAAADTVNDNPPRASKVSFSKQGKPGSAIPLAPGAAAVRPRQSRPLALTYAAIALTGLLFIGSCGPVLSPRAFSTSSSLAGSLSSWSPLPQGLLLALLAALLGAAYLLRKPTQSGSSSSSEPLEMPPGVTMNEHGLLCDAAGSPLPRGLRLAPGGRGFTLGPNDTPLPKGCAVGPGGVLLHAASSCPIPHSCGVSDAGLLLSSTGEPLPDSMAVGPNSTLLAADGTLLSPDLQPVPAGFSLSPCGAFLLRPNGKPVPRGVHVGPGFRLLKPNGEHLPDGVKIGPCGTIICVDGTILCADGHPAPPGFGLNADKTRILDPQGAPVEDSYSMGPNGTLITQDGALVTALGKQPLPRSSWALGPLGNLLMAGQPVAAGAAFDAAGQLVGPAGEVLGVLPGDDGAPCSGQEAPM